MAESTIYVRSSFVPQSDSSSDSEGEDDAFELEEGEETYRSSEIYYPQKGLFVRNKLFTIKEGLRPVLSDPSTLSSSSAVDLASRRGVFSRRHYGSVELLVSCDRDGCNAGRFRVEDGERDEILNLATGSDVHLENPEYQTRWYFKYFLGKIHQNYVGADIDKNLYFISVVLTDANNHNVPQYRAILWRKTGTQKISIPYNPAKPMSVKRILSRFDLKVDKTPKEIYTPEIQKELLLLEEQEGSVNFKFGVLYARTGQLSDDEMFSNENASEGLDNFISLLGERIQLRNWEKFNGGLDVKNNTTGMESVYTMYEGHEIMFHVSTLLPYSKDNRQQVERKRHIGNDIVTIVFQEVEDPNRDPSFKPSMIRSHFTHIFALVTYNKSEDSYRLRVFSEESVPLFGPPLPTPAVFKDHQEFRDFLLVKLINGEKAAFNTPIFAHKRQRTLEALIKNLQQEIALEANKNMLNKRSLSDVIPEPVWGWRSKKEDARQVEFVRVGQMLKLTTIVKGDAPTSLATTSLLRREPWEPQCILNDFPYEVVCGDSWGYIVKKNVAQERKEKTITYMIERDRLVLGTEAGVFIIEEGVTPRIMFDRTVNAKQLSVVEAHGLMLFRTDKGKESRVYVFRLSDFEGEQHEQIVRTKIDCKDHKLERIKGCNLFALSRPGGSHLRMVAAIGKKLVLMTWKHSAAWTTWCMAADTDPVEGFQFVRELSVGEVPTVMSLVDGGREDNQICVGYRHQFDLINEKNGDTFRLHSVDTNKVNLVSALDIYEEDEPELLLSYNHVSQFRNLMGESTSDFDIHWNSAPKAIVCAFPYILAFTPDSLEIRLVVNGNLVHTMSLSKLNIVCSKCDMFFTTASIDMLQPSPKEPNRTFCPSPMASPTNANPVSPLTGAPVRIFKIPLISLVGQMTDRALSATGNRPRSFISPLVNIAESPANFLLQRSDSPLGVIYGVESGSNTEESKDNHSSGNTIGLHPYSESLATWVSKSPIIPRPSAEYSDSGYSESDFSFESVDGSLPHSANLPLRGGSDSAETRRKVFGCVRSPRLQRRTVSTHADNEARAELFGHHHSQANRFGRPVSPRPRYGSNQSDSVFYSGTPKSDSRTSSLQSETADSKYDMFSLSTRSVSNSSTQSEADMRAELLGKLLHSPRLGHVSSAPVLDYDYRSDSGSVFEPINLPPESPSPPPTITHVPFHLSSSVDDDEIDLK